MTDAEERLDELEEEVREIREYGLTEGSMEIAMLRRLAYGLAGDGVDAETNGLPEAVASAIERVDELERENERLRSRLDKLGDIGEQKSSKEQKIAAIVTYAEQRRSDGQDALVVKPGTIKGLVDISERYSYTLVDDMIDEFDWAHDPSKVQRYGAVERDAPDKGVLIDFEGVHGEAVPLSKFINEPAEKGVAN